MGRPWIGKGVADGEVALVTDMRRVVGMSRIMVVSLFRDVTVRSRGAELVRLGIIIKRKPR